LTAARASGKAHRARGRMRLGTLLRNEKGLAETDNPHHSIRCFRKVTPVPGRGLACFEEQ
jgi:hypothetical protein